MRTTCSLSWHQSSNVKFFQLCFLFAQTVEEIQGEGVSIEKQGWGQNIQVPMPILGIMGQAQPFGRPFPLPHSRGFGNPRLLQQEPSQPMDPDHGKAIAIAAYIRQLGVAKWVNLQ
jgi:hypothetical protein